VGPRPVADRQRIRVFYGFIVGYNHGTRASTRAHTGGANAHPEEGYHLTEDLATTPSAGYTSRRPWYRTSRSFSTSHRRHPRAPPCTEGMDQPLRAGSTRDGTHCASALRRQKSWGDPVRRDLTDRPQEIPAWATSRSSEAGAGSPDGGFAGFSRTPTISRPSYRHLEELEILDTPVLYLIGDNGRARRNAQRHVQRTAGLQPDHDLETPEFLAHTLTIRQSAANNHYAVDGPRHCTPYQWTKQVASHFGAPATGWSPLPMVSPPAASCGPNSTTWLTSPPPPRGRRHPAPLFVHGSTDALPRVP